jgi:SAM-dependent methyltransferase
MTGSTLAPEDLGTAATGTLDEARFEVRDAAGLSVEEPFDVVFVFDAIHDQVDPAAVLERIHADLAPGGTFVMVEPRVSSDLAGTWPTRWRRCCTRRARCTA